LTELAQPNVLVEKSLIPVSLGFFHSVQIYKKNHERSNGEFLEVP